MHTSALVSARFRGDVELLDAVRRDDLLKQQLQRTEMLRRRSRVRTRLLGDAVCVNVNLMPNVARSFERLQSYIDDDKPLEAYVLAEPSVSAFVTEASNRYIVAVSSGAVNLLSAEELEFVIGHELGHAVFGHLDVAADAIIELGPLDLRQRMLVRAWQRASEISADRAGLLCCNSLEVAATALFKTACGLDLPGVVIDPKEFADQWDRLVEEVLDQGSRDHWRHSHPFPPLRMKALMLFWQHRGEPEGDEHVTRLLAHMGSHPGVAGQSHDPLLSRFNFWGAIYMSLADGALDPGAIERLQAMAPPGIDLDGLLSSASSLPELCLEHFREAKRTRREKLSASELHRIATRLVELATHDGNVTARRVEHLQHLSKELGLGPGAVQLMISKRLGKE